MLSIEKVVAIVIFLIVFIVLIFFTQIPNAMGNQINLQNEMRECCKSYVNVGCPDTLNAIKCSSDANLDALATELSLDVNQTKKFCNCPANKTYG